MKLAKARQIFVLSVPKGAFKVETVSSIGAVDRNAIAHPSASRVSSGSLPARPGWRRSRPLPFPAYCPPGEIEQDSYPFRFMAWVPFRLRDGHIFAGMLRHERRFGRRRICWLPKGWPRLIPTPGAHRAGPRRLKRKLPIKPPLGIVTLAGTGRDVHSRAHDGAGAERGRSCLSGDRGGPARRRDRGNPRQPERER